MSVEIKYLGHSGFQIKYAGYSILIDPFIISTPQASIPIARIDVNDILVTHAHGDHLGDSIIISKEKGAPITAIFELANYCTQKGATAQGVNIGGKVEFPWGYAYWLPAAHSSSTPEGFYGGVAASILLNIDGITIYHAGDTGLHIDMLMIGEFYKPTISILPIGGYYTMGIDEAVMATKWLGSPRVIPMHYNTFPTIEVDPEEFKQKIQDETNSDCIILRPAESYLT